MTNKVGQQIGNYRLVKLFGTGGFAEVYLWESIFISKTERLLFQYKPHLQPCICRYSMENRLLYTFRDHSV